MRRAFAGVLLLGLLSVSPVSAQLPTPTAPAPLAQQPPDQPPAPQPMTQQAPTGKADDPTRLDPVVVTVDLFLSRGFGKWFEAYLAIDNLLDTTYTTGRTSEGVISIGEPRIIRGGVRVHF